MSLENRIEAVVGRACDWYRAAAVGDVDLFRNWAQGKCESPIEVLFAVAYLSYLQVRGGTTIQSEFGLGNSGPMYGGHFESYLCWTEDKSGTFKPLPMTYAGELNFINPQAQFGEFRVDFLIKRFASPYTNGNPYFETPHVVIECDGHDFHERTKEQAMRDRSRDRAIQDLGYPVLRFTGAEIWRDPWSIAGEVDRFMTKRIYEAFDPLK